jgi:hypothetical protein
MAKGQTELQRTWKGKAFLIGTVNQNGTKAQSERFSAMKNIRAMPYFRRPTPLISFQRKEQRTMVRCLCTMLRTAIQQ